MSSAGVEYVYTQPVLRSNSKLDILKESPSSVLLNIILLMWILFLTQSVMKMSGTVTYPSLN